MANQSLSVYIKDSGIKKKIADRLGRNATAFTTALLNIYQNNELLKKCDADSILGAGMLAATMNLSITPTLGQAYIVPFGTKAQLQIGVRGYVQLALRTGQYTRIYAGKVCEGEFRGFNPMTGEPIIGEKISDNVAGYVAYFRMVNGFEKTLYMSRAEIEEYAEKYSRSFSYDRRSGKKSSPWSTNFDDMASKTVLKKLLRSWGMLSADFVTAEQADQSAVDDNTFTYVDNGGNVQNRDEVYLPEGNQETVKADTGEVVGDLKLETTPDTEKKDGVPF